MLRTTLAVLLPALAAAQTLVLIGGNLKDDNAPVWRNLVQVAGGKGNASIAVVSLAQDANGEVNKVIDNFVRVYGAKSATHIRLSGNNANSQQIADAIRQRTGIFLVESVASLPAEGSVLNDVSSQERQNLIRTLRPSGIDSLALTAIKDVLAGGGMVAGNGAILGKGVTILSGDSMTALLMGTSHEQFMTGPKNPLQFDSNGGLGFLDNYVIDSHLSEKGREVRLMRTLLETRNIPQIGVNKGFGIDENTAFFITNPITRPVGKIVTDEFSVSGIFFVDVSNTSSSEVEAASYRNVPFSFYTVNDTVELPSEKATFAPWKVSIAGEEWFEDAIPSTDILSQQSPSEWRKTGRRLIDCKELNVTSFSHASQQPSVKVIMDRIPAVGYGADIPDDPKKTYLPSFYNMLVSLEVSSS